MTRVLGSVAGAESWLRPFDELAARRPKTHRRHHGGRLGEVLIERGLLTHSELAAALEEQNDSGRRLGEILLHRGFVSGPTLVNALAEQYELELEFERGFGSGLRNAIEDRHARLRPAQPPATVEVPPEESPATRVPAPAPRRRLGELLMMEGLLTATELDAALAEQQDSGLLLGEIILARGLISAPMLVDALAAQLEALNLSTDFGSGLRTAIQEPDRRRRRRG
jgi:hypothetical protein